MTIKELFTFTENYAEHGIELDQFINFVQYFMIALFVGWTIFFFYCLVSFWHKKHPKSTKGVQGHASLHVEIGVIIIEAILLVAFAFPKWKERTDTFEKVMLSNPERVRVVGWQFGWTYHYPGKDGLFGRIDSRQISGSNELGIDKNDPNGADDFTSAILKLPVSVPAILQVTSKDVIHNYAIIPMRIQQDALPGKDIPMWFTPLKTMETYVVCGQLCGEGHANMVGTMEIIEEQDYREWFEAQ